MAKRVTKEEFLQRAKKLFGDYYTYEKVDYKGVCVPVEVTCPKHGPFMKKPSDFLQGKGCHSCYLEKKGATKESFLQKAAEKFGDKFDYSKVEYVNSRTKVQIICRKHGPFWQTPSQHLQGSGGCEDCQREGQRVTMDEFIARSVKAHGHKYDYKNVVIERVDLPVEIICPVHGPFKQIPSSHMRGEGCDRCARELKAAKLRKPVDKFIKEAKAVHGETYDYSEVKYTNEGSYVSIICKKHGAFPQTPKNHLNGAGCPICGKIRTSSLSERAVYFYIKKAFKDAESNIEIEGYHPDVVLPSLKVIVEYDGWLWHKDKIDADTKKTEVYKKAGYKVIRVRELDLPDISGCINIRRKKMSIPELEVSIREVLRELKAEKRVNVSLKRDNRFIETEVSSCTPGKKIKYLETGEVFRSISAAARAHGLDKGTLGSGLVRNNNVYKGFALCWFLNLQKKQSALLWRIYHGRALLFCKKNKQKRGQSLLND